MAAEDRAPDVFHRQAGDYDAVRRRLIPPFDDFYGTAVVALGLAARPPRRILDLGSRVFVNAEQVAGPTPRLDAAFCAWHRERALALGASEQDCREAEERMAFDRCASVEDQLGWLRDAGFADARCLFQDRCFAVLVGLRPG